MHFLKIYFDSENSTFHFKVPKENSSFSKAEYIACWNEILTCVDVFKPLYLLIDTFELNYWYIPEIEYIFNTISSKMGASNIAVVRCNNILGQYTLETLIKVCPSKGHNIFKNKEEGISWLKAKTTVCQPIKF
jgi:hypothetical protein